MTQKLSVSLDTAPPLPPLITELLAKVLLVTLSLPQLLSMAPPSRAELFREAAVAHREGGSI